MKFCQEHWQQLRQKIDDRGLAHLVPKNGAVATQQMQSQLRERAVTKENFDPLMGAHWAIASNAMQVLQRAGVDPLYLMMEPAPGRTDCPLCELNRIHKEGCREEKCTLDKERGYDFFLDLAADEQLARAREIGLVGAPS